MQTPKEKGLRVLAGSGEETLPFSTYLSAPVTRKCARAQSPLQTVRNGADQYSEQLEYVPFHILRAPQCAAVPAAETQSISPYYRNYRFLFAHSAI